MQAVVQEFLRVSWLVADGELASVEKRKMLEGIDNVMRGGEHAHIVR